MFHKRPHKNKWKTVSFVSLQVEEFENAARLCLDCDLVREAVDAFIAGSDWENARKVARDMEPALESYVESR